MTQLTISVAKDFSPYPGPRFKVQGKYSGEVFRKEHLVPALQKFKTVLVDLDGTTGFGSSFLDEAFGGLIRVEGFSLKDIEKRVKLKSEADQTYLLDIDEALHQAVPA